MLDMRSEECGKELEEVDGRQAEVDQRSDLNESETQQTNRVKKSDE